MRRAHVVLLLLAATILALLLFYFGDFNAPGVGHKPVGGKGAATGSATSAGEGGGFATVDGRPESDAPTGRVHKFDPQDVRRYGKFGENFLRDRGESAYNLLAVFAATGQFKYLQRALERYPADPAVLYLAFSNNPEERDQTPLIERFKLAAPDNPIPFLYSAVDLLKKGRPEAIAALKAALERPALYNYLHERAAGLRELALYAGDSADQADRAGLFAQELPELSAAMGVANRLRAALAEQDPSSPDVIANTRLLYELSRMFQTPGASRTLMGHRIALSIETMALESAAKLPENPLQIELQPRLETLGEMAKEADFLSESRSSSEVPPSLWDEYFQKVRLEGDLVALRWLVQKRQIER